MPPQPFAVLLLDPTALLGLGMLEEFSVRWDSGVKGGQLMHSRALPHQDRTALLDRPQRQGSFAPLGRNALVGQQGCRHATLLEGSTVLLGRQRPCYVRRGVTALEAERRLWNAWPILEGEYLSFILVYILHRVYCDNLVELPGIKRFVTS